MIFIKSPNCLTTFFFKKAILFPSFFVNPCKKNKVKTEKQSNYLPMFNVTFNTFFELVPLPAFVH